MNEPQHFKYEGNVNLKDGKQIVTPARTTIASVDFLTPAKLNLIVDGEQIRQMVNIDIINRKVYLESGDEWMSDKVFEYLDSVNSLPEDFFAAPDELHEKVANLEEERLRTKEDIIGIQHE